MGAHPDPADNDLKSASNPSGGEIHPVDAQAAEDVSRRLTAQARSFRQWASTAPADVQNRLETAPGGTQRGSSTAAGLDPAFPSYEEREMSSVRRDVAERLKGSRPLKAIDLWASYKDAPQHPSSTFLKYLVHRLNHLDEYDDPETGFALDKEFHDRVVRVDNPSRHVTLGHLHGWLAQHGPNVAEDLLRTRQAHQQAILDGLGLSVRDIDGEPYVALTRGLDTPVMANEQSLSSAADLPVSQFGTNTHHMWVPVKDVWHVYALGHPHTRSEYGTENEFVLSNTGRRFEAQEGDVQSGKHLINTEAAGERGTGLRDIEPRPIVTDKSTDAQLAAALAWHDKHGATFLPRSILDHPNAGPQVLAQFQRGRGATSNVAQFGVTPAAQAVALAQSNPDSVGEVLRNPNLTTADLVSVVDADLPKQAFDRRPYAIHELLNHPAATSGVVDRLAGGLLPETLVTHASIFAKSPLVTPQALDRIAQALLGSLSSLTPEQVKAPNYDPSVHAAVRVLKSPQASESTTATLLPLVVKDHKAIIDVFAGAKLPRPFVESVLNGLDPVTGRSLDQIDPDNARAYRQGLKLYAKFNHFAHEDLLWQAYERKFISLAELGQRFGHATHNPGGSSELLERIAAEGVSRNAELGGLPRGDFLTPKAVKMLAHHPSGATVVEDLGMNRKVPNEWLEAAWPASQPDPAQIAEPFSSSPWSRLAGHIMRRRGLQQRRDTSHILKTIPAHLAKNDMWAIQARNWLHRRTKHTGYYWTTTRAQAIAALEDGYISPETTDELLEGSAVFAHKATPERLKRWGPDDEKNTLIYFEPTVEPEGVHLGQHYWTTVVPFSSARIEDLRETGFNKSEDLAKFHPTPTFPKLGIGDDRRQTKIVNTPGELKTVTRAQAEQHVHNTVGPNYYNREGGEAQRRTFVDRRANDLKGSFGSTTGMGPHDAPISWALGEGMRGQFATAQGDPTYDATGVKSDLTTGMHEDWHQISHRVKQKYGSAGRETLMQNMLEAIPSQYSRDFVEPFSLWRRGGVDSTEELLATVINYLNNPRERERYHREMKHTPEQIRAFSTGMKRSYEALRAAAQVADERWLTLRQPWRPRPTQQPWQTRKSEMHGPLRFPRLGLPDDRRETYIIKSGPELELRARVLATDEAKAKMEPGTSPANLRRSVAQIRKNLGKAKYPGFAAENDPHVAYALAPSPWAKHNLQVEATVQHENMHLMLNRVKEKFGADADSKLASNLLEAIPSPMRKAVMEFARYRNGPGTYNPASGAYTENLTYLLDYVNNPNERKTFHKDRKDSDVEALEFHGLMKQAHRNLLAVAEVATPAWALVEKPWEYRTQHPPGEQTDFVDVGSTWGRWAGDSHWWDGMDPDSEEVVESSLEEPEMRKSLKGLVAGAALALTPAMTAQDGAYRPPPTPAPVVRVEGLNPHLQAIRHLESSDGKNTNHAPHSKGPYHTAVGDVALKPVVAHEVYLRTPRIQKEFPGLESPNAFTEAFKGNTGLYNTLANRHWTNLLASFRNNANRAAYAWRYGPAAAASTKLADVMRSGYVKDFSQLVQGKHTGKKKAKPRIAMKSEGALNLVGDSTLEPHEMSAAIEQLGENPEHNRSLAAAHFLVGHKTNIDEDAFRLALSVHGGDHHRAALYAVGLADSEKNLKALRAVLALGGTSLAKTEEEPGVDIVSVEPAVPEAREAAESIQRAVEAGLTQPLKLKGKHSLGATACRDPKTGELWLLKPGSGKPSPAAGVQDDGSSQSCREVAYSHIARLVGLGGMHPRAELVLVNAEQWAAVRFLPSFRPLDERNKEIDGYARAVLGPYLKRGDLHRIAALAYCLGETDFHGQNVLVHGEAITCIDHGSSFAGKNFDPGHDPKSFIPYILRVFSEPKLAKLPPEDRVRSMPTLDHQMDEMLREWVEGIDADEVVLVMDTYNIGESAQRAVLARLADLKAAPGSMSEHVNALWAGLAEPVA